jgi:hypothetical protein
MKIISTKSTTNTAISPTEADNDMTVMRRSSCLSGKQLALT